jgi:hypothetical protein
MVICLIVSPGTKIIQIAFGDGINTDTCLLVKKVNSFLTF